MKVSLTVSRSVSRPVSLLALTCLVGVRGTLEAQRPSVPPTAAARRAAERITPANMRSRIGRLASDSLLGRNTPSPELDGTATYIAAEFRRMGLRPAGDSGGYIQRFPIRCTRPDSTSYVGLTMGGTSVRWPLGREVAAFAGRLRDGDSSGPTVLVAGIPTDTADLFGDLELRGATILAVVPAQHLQVRARLMPHVMRALQRGASTWIIVTNVAAADFGGMAAGGTQPSCNIGAQSDAPALTMLGVRDSSAMTLFRAVGEDVAALLATQATIVRAVPGLTTQLHGVSRVTREATAPNAIGILPGSDPTLRAEHVVVTAHMDHLGVGKAVNGDSIFNGADDNASGTAAVLEIAQAFTRLGVRPRRSLLFLAVSGEERGLWGSGWYVNHPAVPLSHTVAAINLDMISRGWRDSVALIGLDDSTLNETIRRVARENRSLVAQPVTDHWPQQNFLNRSDHISFARRGVPFLYFLDGTPPAYHRVTDAVDDIDDVAAARIARLAFLTALDVANAATQPAWDAASRQRIVTGQRVADAYLGQKPPGRTPEVFAPGIISTGRIHSRLEISPDGREMYWNTVDLKSTSARLLFVRDVDGQWSAPQSPPFAKAGDTQGALFSPDGTRLYFRRNTGAGWVAHHVERTLSGWSEPRTGGFAPSGSASFTRSGRVYFSAHLPTKVWNSGIFAARYSEAGYGDASVLDSTINVPNAIDYTPFVSPDESFLLFSSNRPLIADKEEMFVHVAFRGSDGGWSSPRRVTDIPGRFPSLSPDGKYLFFCGDDGNIYWADRSIIDQLNPAGSQAASTAASPIATPAVASPSPQAPGIPASSLYLGQAPPGDAPKVFPLEVTAGSFAAERIAISGDGTTIYYQELDGYTALDGKPHTERTKSYRFADGRWHGPTTLFEGFVAPAFSPSEDTLFIQRIGGQSYYSVRNDTGWGTPLRWASKLRFDHYLQVTTAGRYYASSTPANSLGGLDRSRILVTARDTTATSLGLPVNTAATDYDFFVARDESFMIIARHGTLAVSFPRQDGGWTNPKSLGGRINFGLGAWGPYVTNDNRYLFYTTGTKPDYSDTHIYWVRIAGVIDSLRQTNYTPYLRSRIPPQTLSVAQEFRYVVPDTAFIDDEGGPLTYSATLADGRALPSWLTFDAATHTFAGTPPTPGVIRIRVTATDAARASASADFEFRTAAHSGEDRGSLQ